MLDAAVVQPDDLGTAGDHPARGESSPLTLSTRPVGRSVLELDGGSERAKSTATTSKAMRSTLLLAAILHGEWVRIHPFANGNGRTARLWAI
jgi:hypothetical protein